jgi:hypothetical protein
MDSFSVVRKTPSSLTNAKESGVLRNLETTTSKSQQHIRARPRYAPYSTEERVRRIQKALDDVKGDEHAALPDCPHPDVPRPSSNISESQTRSSHLEAEARTRHVSQSACKKISEHGRKSGQVLKREHVLNMKHCLNPIVHSNAPRKSRE